MKGWGRVLGGGRGLAPLRNQPPPCQCFPNIIQESFQQKKEIYSCLTLGPFNVYLKLSLMILLGKGDSQNKLYTNFIQ